MIRIGMAVYTSDGVHLGNVVKVVLDPHRNWHLTDFIVERGVFFKRDRVIPADLVERVEDDRIVLRLSSEEARSLPLYREMTVEQPAEVPSLLPYEPARVLMWIDPYAEAKPVLRQRIRLGVDPDEHIVGRGTQVWATDGPVGVVDHVLIDPETHKIVGLVVRQNRWLFYDIVIPADWITEIGDDFIWLSRTREEVRALPRVKAILPTDAELAEAVAEALISYDRTRLGDVQVTASGGEVYLWGTVPSSSDREAAEAVAGRVPGVVAVHSAIATDAGTEARVRRVIREWPESLNVEATVLRGVVTLKGIVPSEEVRQALVEHVRNVRGVRDVRDLLVVPSPVT